MREAVGGAARSRQRLMDSQNAYGTEHDANSTHAVHEWPTHGPRGRQDAWVSVARRLRGAEVSMAEASKGPTDPGRPSSWTPRALMARSTMPKAPTESMSGPPLGRGGVNTRGVCGAGVSVGRGLSGTGVSRAGGVKRRGPSRAGAPRMKGRSRRADRVRRAAGAAGASVPPAARACRRLRPPTRSRRNRPPNRNGR